MNNTKTKKIKQELLSVGKTRVVLKKDQNDLTSITRLELKPLAPNTEVTNVKLGCTCDKVPL